MCVGALDLVGSMSFLQDAMQRHCVQRASGWVVFNVEIVKGITQALLCNSSDIIYVIGYRCRIRVFCSQRFRMGDLQLGDCQRNHLNLVG